MSTVDVDALTRLFGLEGRVVIVTGASSGLGQRFATVLHGAGAEVVLAARRLDRLESLAASLGQRAVPMRADLSDADDRERLVERTVDRFGRLDVLVNNAGTARPTPAEDETLEHLGSVMELNLAAPFHLSQLAARHMLEAGSGSIVNVASILGIVASSPMKDASYCASKGALVNLTRQLGCEWGRKGVRVNALAPGWFPTEMNQDTMFDDAAGMSFIRSNTPMGRGGELSELDGAVLFLAGDASSYVTGHVLAVDGGWVAR